MVKIWNENEIELLFSNYENGTKELLMSLFPDKTYHQIQMKGKSLGLNKNNRYYTLEEENFIKDNYFKLRSGEIGRILNKSSKAINTKAKIMGLVKQLKWNDAEIEKLKYYYGKETVEYISKNILIGRTEYSIHHKSIEIGLQNTQPSYENITKDELIMMLANFFNEKGRTPFKEELGNDGFPSYFAFTNNFGNYSSACILAGIPINTGLFRGKICYSKNGDKCYSAAEKRITDFLIDNNIYYEKEVFYSDIFKDESVGKIRCDWILNDYSVVEYFGLSKFEEYKKKMEIKRELCYFHNVNLIEIFENDLNNLDNIFFSYL